ncbi:putative diacylglycerol O-acyltransferase 2-like protein DGAT2L7P [Enhydra lutris kenyoni]|uniref:Diacylglycerol O-acyltransferase 2-like protein DGAT2L7P n=1 Tax=Enhydra lutris kenyoni TaxID=391180 RepID=A0A2Y9J687_ENHLU|nr:putative diacylglycerol O-acyltransferase 2-like protein DGAT2L7P [Enhydra lutris kenyoni]
MPGAFSNIRREATGFTSLSPGLPPHLLMLPRRFRLPLFPCSDEKRALSNWPWNTAEDAAVARRDARGLPSRAGLVPVLSFGDDELFQQFPNPPGSWLRSAQEALGLQRSLAAGHALATPASPPLATAQGLNRWAGRAPSQPPPLGRPVLPAGGGGPIPVQRSARPSRAQVDALHALDVERLPEGLEAHEERSGIAAHPHPLLT